MAKEAYYFSHDSNARHDEKVLSLRSIYGSEGYGWFWMIVEMLRDASEYRLQCSGKYFFKTMAKELDCTPEKFEVFYGDCITEFKLFATDGEYFWSESLHRRMEKRDEKSRKGVEAANKRWSNLKPVSDSNANPMPTQCQPNANKGKENKGKENKGKENKGKENNKESVFSPPNIDLIKQEFSKTLSEPSANLEAKKFFNHYEGNGWMIGKAKMKSWTHAVASWVSKINEFHQNKQDKFISSRNIDVSAPKIMREAL